MVGSPWTVPNRDFIESFDIEGANVTTAPKYAINYTLFLNWIEFFANSVPDSVARSLALFYDDCCNHYNNEIVIKQLILKSYCFYC